MAFILVLCTTSTRGRSLLGIKTCFLLSDRKVCVLTSSALGLGHFLSLLSWGDFIFFFQNEFWAKLTFISAPILNLYGLHGNNLIIVKFFLTFYYIKICYPIETGSSCAEVRYVSPCLKGVMLPYWSLYCVLHRNMHCTYNWDSGR